MVQRRIGRSSPEYTLWHHRRKQYKEHVLSHGTSVSWVSKHRNIQSIIRLIITDKIASERGATFDHLPGLPMPIQSSLAPRELRVHR